MIAADQTATGTWMMQYPITLPADYDMQIIRDRVRDKGSILDNRPGLVFKAYAIRERGVDGSPVNQYAPFYLWSSTAAAAEFLMGPDALFGNIIVSFGRPQVRTWLPTAVGAGPTAGADVTMATQWNRPLPGDCDLIEATARLGSQRTSPPFPPYRSSIARPPPSIRTAGRQRCTSHPPATCRTEPALRTRTEQPRTPSRCCT